MTTDENVGHVIRGEEWLPSMPYTAQPLLKLFWLGCALTAHSTIDFKPIGNGKLSKRDV
jgi:glutamyl/glutaminyl-tRNA synthetase